MTPLVLTLALALGAQAMRADLGPEASQCTVIRIAADGARTNSPPTRPYRRPTGVVSSVATTGSGSAQSAVSASSSTRGGESRSEIRTRRDGRAVTRTYDNRGCTIVVDDRPPQETRHDAH